jgi:hypothetical protein
MASAILDGTNIDTSVFSYSAPKANPAGGKVVNLYNKNFKVQSTAAERKQLKENLGVMQKVLM